MTESDIQVYLFEYGGGVVVGTRDLDLARTKMQQRIREEWEDHSPVPWQMYDFTFKQPAIEHGRIIEDATDLEYALWMISDEGSPAVIWR